MKRNLSFRLNAGWQTNCRIKPAIIGTLVLLSLLFFAESCKKTSTSNSSGSGNYYLKFKANGEQKSYTSEILAQVARPTSDGLYSGGIIGYKDFTQGAKDEIAIILFSTSTITTTTYADPGKAVKQDGSILPKAVINYVDPGGATYMTMGVLADANGNIIIPNVKADAVVTITELGSNYMKGTFSGTSYEASDGSYSTTVLITEGEFNLPLSK